MELIPVIEFEASRFAKKEHEFPQVSGVEDPAGWDLYWRNSLADSGIHDITPLSGSTQVPIENLRPEVLRIYISNYLKELEEEYDLEYISPMKGDWHLKI